MTHTPKVLALALGALIVLAGCSKEQPAASAPAADTGKPALTVNGKPVSQTLVDLIVKQRVSQGQPDTPDLRQAVHDDLATREVIYQEAVKKGLDQTPEVKAQLEFAQKSVLTGAYLQDYMKTHPITDEQLKAEYDKIKTQMGDAEYRARHILVPTEAEAKEVIAKLKGGAKFEQLAKERSKDPGSKDKGGDLDWNGPGAFVKPFADAMAKLEKGQYTTEPVQTQFGWHVIRLDDKRPLKIPAFEEVKEQLRQRVEQEQVQKTVTALREQAKVEDPLAKPAPKDAKQPAAKEEKPAAKDEKK